MSGERVLQSFVARIWLEYEQNGEPHWRGHIRYVQGSREVHFQDLNGMCEFLKSVTGVDGPLLTGRRSEEKTTVSGPGAAIDEKPDI
ncbi:MAG TPA: hypothetical protein ENI79_01970 [Rhodospirillales bacterium]|nr:hypothetical protein [Rhodospirillales bacterium]